jgi:S-DNA-T family DNA segregation ATPase FtsK/SpoIIIE
MDMISDEMQRRKEILSDYSGSFETYNRQNEKKMHLIVVIINNYDIFTEAMPRSVEPLNEFFREAPKCGIIFIVSTNAPSGLPSRMLSNFNHYILMQLADDNNYRGLTNCRRGLIPKKVIGRGICKLDPTNVDSYCEFQTAMIDTEENENKTIRDFAKRSVDYYKCKVRQLAKIPDDIQSADLISRINEIKDTPIGISLHQKDLATYDLESQKIHMFIGHSVASSLESIYALTMVMTKLPNVKVRVLDLLGIFKMPILDIQKFDQDPNSVVAALEKDIEVRSKQSSCGINIIIGAGRYKQVLNQQGQASFENIIKTVDKSNQTIYIFIDDYESIRTFKAEEWFNKIGKNGLWLGPSPNAQTLFEGLKFTDEDINYNFPGLAYKITGDEYDVIKLAIDKDI